jgi:hypothetical protein
MDSESLAGLLRAIVHEEPSIMGMEPDRKAVDGLRSEAKTLVDNLHSEADNCRYS